MKFGQIKKCISRKDVISIMFKNGGVDLNYTDINQVPQKYDDCDIGKLGVDSMILINGYIFAGIEFLLDGD